MKKRLMFLFVGFLLWFIIHSLIITYDGLNDSIAASDVAVVLGNKVELDGRPSKRLQARLDRGVELYKNDLFHYVIVSGGTGREGLNEAVVMKRYLEEKGIPAENIIIDQNGNNSYMTAQNTKTIMRDMGLNSVTIITQFYHITRTELAFEKVGLENVYTAHANYYEMRDIYSLFREFFAYYKYLLM